MTSLKKCNDLYRVTLSGKIKNGIDKACTVNTVSKTFNVPPEKIATWFDGKKRTIKSGLLFEKAKQYFQVLDKAGAVAEINLLFLKSVLESSTYVIKNRIVQNAEKKTDIRKSTSIITDADLFNRTFKEDITLATADAFQFDRYGFSPLVFSSEKNINVYNNANQVIGTFQTAKPIIGWALTLFCSILTAFITQYLLKGVLIQTVSGGLLTTLVLSIVFLMTLLFLPKYLIPRKEVCIMESDKNRNNLLCKCSEVKKGTALCRYYQVMDENDIAISNIKYHLLFSEQICSLNDKILFSSKNEEEDEQDAMTELCETVYEELSTLGNVIGIIRSKFQMSSNEQSETEKQIRLKRVVRDENNNIAAYLYYGTSSLFKQDTLCSVEIIKKSLTRKERSILIAFSLVMAGI